MLGTLSQTTVNSLWAPPPITPPPPCTSPNMRHIKKNAYDTQLMMRTNVRVSLVAETLNVNLFSWRLGWLDGYFGGLNLFHFSVNAFNSCQDESPADPTTFHWTDKLWLTGGVRGKGQGIVRITREVGSGLPPFSFSAFIFLCSLTMSPVSALISPLSVVPFVLVPAPCVAAIRRSRKMCELFDLHLELW